MNAKMLITIIAALAVKSTALAHSKGENSRQRTSAMERGIYYALSPELAAHLNIDYVELVRALRVRDDQGIVVKKTEEHDGVDISIFDSHQFAQARMDFVIQ
ncbi:MAG: hypothetical protein AB7G93_01060 [Bdellovibrionales bacterium]